MAKRRGKPTIPDEPISSVKTKVAKKATKKKDIPVVDESIEEPKSNAGQPAYYESDDLLNIKIEEYFKSIQGEWRMEEKEDPETGKFEDVKVWDVPPEVPTITGLCLFLGFESRQSFYDYGKKSEFSYTIKRAKLRIEHEYEKALNYSRVPTAQIFALKNLGWSDKQEIDHTTKGQSLNDKADLSKLTDEELRLRAEIDRKSHGA